MVRNWEWKEGQRWATGTGGVRWKNEGLRLEEMETSCCVWYPCHSSYAHNDMVTTVKGWTPIFHTVSPHLCSMSSHLCSVTDRLQPRAASHFHFGVKIPFGKHVFLLL